ncbi:hypothetical protein HNP68_001057 [Borrelia yangtzensis]|uniref:Uncharacterized protein n=1 Tax=Borreliella yangtzensis TaxID=683292 RepID=A0ABR6PCY8_9SPIR|nr:hypothetical protein [Borreliella yangtzensis]
MYENLLEYELRIAITTINCILEKGIYCIATEDKL